VRIYFYIFSLSRSGWRKTCQICATQHVSNNTLRPALPKIQVKFVQDVVNKILATYGAPKLRAAAN
jgi:hypothetical protein